MQGGEEEEENVRKDRRRRRRRRGEVLRWGGGLIPELCLLDQCLQTCRPSQATTACAPLLYPLRPCPTASIKPVGGAATTRPQTKFNKAPPPPPIAECLPGAVQHAQASPPLVLPPRLPSLFALISFFLTSVPSLVYADSRVWLTQRSTLTFRQ